MMPPPSSNLKLSSREIKLIEKWIKQGAAYEKHWAFVVPKKPALPTVSQKDWPKNEMDYFILKSRSKRDWPPTRKRIKKGY